MSLLNKSSQDAKGIEFSLFGLDHREFTWNERLNGTLTLTAGSHAASVTKLRLSLLAVENYPDGNVYDRFQGDTILAQELTFEPGSAQSFPFALLVPDGANLSGWPGGIVAEVSNKWYLQVKVEIPRAKDLSLRWDISIVPPPSPERLAHAVTQVAPFEIRYRNNVANSMVYDFRPPHELLERLDGVGLKVQIVGDQVRGTLDINPQEHSVLDRLKALGHKDIVHEPISFPVASLIAADTSAEFQAVVARLQTLLQPYLLPG